MLNQSSQDMSRHDKWLENRPVALFWIQGDAVMVLFCREMPSDYFSNILFLWFLVWNTNTQKKINKSVTKSNKNSSITNS